MEGGVEKIAGREEGLSGQHKVYYWPWKKFNIGRGVKSTCWKIKGGKERGKKLAGGFERNVATEKRMGLLSEGVFLVS